MQKERLKVTWENIRQTVFDRGGREILIPPSFLDQFASAYRDFVGSDAAFFEAGREKSGMLPIEMPMDIDCRLVRVTPSCKRFDDPFFDWLVSHPDGGLTSLEREVLLGFYSNDGMVVQFHRHQAPDELAEIIAGYAKVNATMLVSLNSYSEKVQNGDITPEEEGPAQQSLEVIDRARVTDGIRYYALFPDVMTESSVVQTRERDKVLRVIEKLNQLADSREEGYNLMLAVRKIASERSEISKYALGATPFVGAILRIIERSAFIREFPFIPMILAHLVGESLSMVTLAGDRIDLEKAKSFFGQLTQSLGKVNQELQEQGGVEQGDDDRTRKIKNRTLLMLVNLATATGLSYVAEATSSLLTFAGITPLNFGVQFIYEILERAREIEKQLAKRGLQPYQREEEIDRATQEISPVLHSIARLRLPTKIKTWLLSAAVLRLNNYAIGNLEGVVLAFILAPLLDTLGVPREYIYALVAMGIESAVALTHASLANRRDPFDSFSRRFATTARSEYKMHPLEQLYRANFLPPNYNADL